MKLIICAAFLALAIAACSDPAQDTRAAIYEAAQTAVRDKMKIPKSTTFPALPETFTVSNPSDQIKHAELHESDSVSITIVHHVAFVEGTYESQNSFGAMLPGRFKATIMYDSVAHTWNPENVELSK